MIIFIILLEFKIATCTCIHLFKCAYNGIPVTACSIKAHRPVSPTQAATVQPGGTTEGASLLAPLQCCCPYVLHLPKNDGSRLLRPGGGVPPVGLSVYGVLRTPDGSEVSPAESLLVCGRLSVLL